MPGPRMTFLQVGKPSAKGKEQAVDEQPVSSAKRHFDETWLKRAMERMECRLQVMICSSLEPISHNVGNLKACVMAVKEQVAPREEDEQDDDSPLDSKWQRDSLAEPYPAMGRELRANPPQGGPALAKKYMGEECSFQTDGCRST